MLCITLQSYNRPCINVTGGLSRVWVFDPADFNFTQDSTSLAYTAVALNTGATKTGGAKMFPIVFQYQEGQRKWKQSRKGCSVKYDHEVDITLPQLSQTLAVFLSQLDAAGCCCGIGVIAQHNDGKIFVLGENIVNGNPIPVLFKMVVDGSEGDSGKVFDDENAVNLSIKGSYSRPAYEYVSTGGVADIVALQ